MTAVPATATPTLTLTPSPAASPTVEPTLTPTRVLFIGNSLTFYHDMPAMFEQLAQSGGRSVEADMSARNAGSFAEHARSPVTLDKIRRGGWDFVVLQEQSAIPANATRRETAMYPHARALAEEIAQTGAQTMFFMTWGYRDGFPDEGHADFATMQAQLAAGYGEIAAELGARIAPVGLAWQAASAQDPSLNLWDSDGVHPTRSGSYLIACVFYAAIFETSPQGLAYNGELPQAQAQFLQQVVAVTVFHEE